MLAQIGAHAAAKFAERLAPLKFTPPQVGILGVISRQNGLSQQALADILSMFPSINSWTGSRCTVFSSRTTDCIWIFEVQISRFGKS